MSNHTVRLVHYVNEKTHKEYIVLITDETDEEEYVEPGYIIEQALKLTTNDSLTTVPTDRPLRED